MGFFVNKKRQEKKLSQPQVNNIKKDIKEEKTAMNFEEKVNAAEAIIMDEKPVKRVKKDKGLIERTESSKTILTEDNKMLLMD